MLVLLDDQGVDGVLGVAVVVAAVGLPHSPVHRHPRAGPTCGCNRRPPQPSRTGSDRGRNKSDKSEQGVSP